MSEIFWVRICKQCGKETPVRMYDLEIITDVESIELSRQQYYWTCTFCSKLHEIEWKDIPLIMREQSELLNVNV